MSIKKVEKYYSIEELCKILKSNRESIEGDIRLNYLKGEYFVKDTDLEIFINREKKAAESKEKQRVRLEKEQKEREEREKIRIRRDEPTIL